MGALDEGNDDVVAARRDAVSADPLSAPARAGLAEALFATESYTEAFTELAAAYRLGMSDPDAAPTVHALLLSIADEFGRRTGMAAEPAPLPPPPAPVESVDVVEIRHVASGPDAEMVPDFTRPEVTLDDVAGLDDVKRHLDVKLLAPLRNPDLAAKYGKVPSGGLLMWGPPGCGKTFIARALAGSLGIPFCAVGVDEILDSLIGSSEQNLASLFAATRERAPAALFFDETDAIGGRRSRMSNAAWLRSLVTVLLTELDGATRDNTGVFVVGATNLPWDVEPALRRPGRFDRTVFVPPPDRQARLAILANRLAAVPLGHDLDLPAIASATPGFSGADVAAVADQAVDIAFSRAVATDNEVRVDQSMLEQAAAAAAPSIRDWIQTAMVAADASNDVELYGPFVEWVQRSDPDR